VAELENLWVKSGRQGLDRVLGILNEAWGRNASAYDAVVLGGLGIVLQKLGASVNDEAMSKRLSKSGGPARMIGQARDKAKADSLPVRRAMAEKFVNVYNKGARNRVRLPD